MAKVTVFDVQETKNGLNILVYFRRAGEEDRTGGRVKANANMGAFNEEGRNLIRGFDTVVRAVIGDNFDGYGLYGVNN